jgi:hypothetical protein
VTAVSRRQVLGAAAAAGLGVVANPSSVLGVDPGPNPAFVAFWHPAAADIPVGTVLGIGPDGLLAPVGQVGIGWFSVNFGIRGPGRAVRRHGQLLLPVAVAGVADILVSARGRDVKVGDMLATTVEVGVAAASGDVYKIVGRALSTLPAGRRGLVRSILVIPTI